jgi:hypothetical protein
MNILGLAEATTGPNGVGPFFHSTTEKLQAGNLLVPARASTFDGSEAAKHVHFTASLDAARRGAELSAGKGSGRIYRVAPTGPFEDDPNNPTLSYRTRDPLRVLDEVRGWQPHSPEVLVFDTSFDYQTDVPPTGRRDPDSASRLLRSHHQLLWTKELSSGLHFAPTAPSVRGHGYLIFTDASGTKHWYGSDAITASYTTYMRPRRLVDAIAGLTKEQRARYLNPPYTIGSAMIWPVRKADRPSINQARGIRSRIADRMDLTLECIRRHYAGEPVSPLADVLTAYADFFALFGRREQGFECFVDFFHFQDLVTPDYGKVVFFLPFDNFHRAGTPATTEEYVTYREATLDFIEKRGRRMEEWFRKQYPETTGDE